MHRHRSSLTTLSRRRLEKSAIRHVRYKNTGSSTSLFPSSSSSLPPSGKPISGKSLWDEPKRKTPRRVSKEDADAAKSMAYTLVNRQSKIRGNWEHTPSLRGEEMRLKSALKEKKRMMSNDQMNLLSNLDAESGDGEEGDSSFTLTPGTFVEIRRNNLVLTGIVIGNVNQLMAEYTVSLEAMGEIRLHRATDVTFMIPSHIPANLAERCGIGAEPESDVQLNARTEVLRRLREVIKAAEIAYNRIWNRHRDIYSIAKSPDPTQWAEVTPIEVAHMLEKQPSSLTVFVCYKYLMNTSLYFVARDPFITTGVFDIRPQVEVDEIRKIDEWKRIQDGPISAFAKKARGVMQKNEKMMAKTALQDPQATESPGIWNKDDKVIISFLLRSLRPHRANQEDPYGLGQSSIMRALDPRCPYVDDAAVYSTLVKLGVVAPWQDIVPFSTSGHYKSLASTSIQEAAVQRSLSLKPPSSGPLGPDDFYPSDPLEAVRHDFGDMPVFVIDDPTALELDDGVSIEEIPSEPGSYWVHAHVANPTATLPPTHVLAQEAMKRGVSQYYSHTSVPLFPSSLTHHPEHGWSLGSMNGQPSRVMTFSGKVDERGELLDIKVRAGVVRNLKIVTYDEVNATLGCSNEGLVEYPFGRTGSPRLTSVLKSKLTESDANALGLLSKVATSLKKKVYDEEVVLFQEWSSEVLFGSFPPGTMIPSLSPYKQFAGFPEFTSYSVYNPELSQVGSKSLVTEVMKLAARIAAKYAHQHDTPVIYRASDSMTFNSPASRKKALALRNADSMVPFQNLVPHVASLPGAKYTTEFKPHAMISNAEGEGYVRITSPLRRALDLVVHWQFHNALLGSKAPNPNPTFSKEWIEKFLISYNSAERHWNKVHENHSLFWKLMFIQKWMDGSIQFKPDVPVDQDPLTMLEGYVMAESVIDINTMQQLHRVLVPKLGIRGSYLGHSGSVLPLGSTVPLKISNLHIGTRSQIIFEPR